jgi:predicted protein tyrosine phosphatase
MRVRFISRAVAKKLCVVSNTDIALLSISDNIRELNQMADLSVIEPTLCLSFHDVDDDKTGMNEQHSLAIIKFVETCFELKKDIVVHCFAGISRSGAVAKWINDHYGLDIDYLNSYKNYNNHVYTMLMNLSSGCINTENSMFNS